MVCLTWFVASGDSRSSVRRRNRDRRHLGLSSISEGDETSQDSQTDTGIFVTLNSVLLCVDFLFFAFCFFGLFYLVICRSILVPRGYIQLTSYPRSLQSPGLTFVQWSETNTKQAGQPYFFKETNYHINLKNVVVTNP